LWATDGATCGVRLMLGRRGGRPLHVDKVSTWCTNQSSFGFGKKALNAAVRIAENRGLACAWPGLYSRQIQLSMRGPLRVLEATVIMNEEKARRDQPLGGERDGLLNFCRAPEVPPSHPIPNPDESVVQH